MTQAARKKNSDFSQQESIAALVTSPGALPLSYRRFEGVKARFRRRTFHEPNLIRIKADPNDLDRLNRFRRRFHLQLNYVQKAKNAHFVKTACQIRYNNLCTYIGSVHEKVGVGIKAVPKRSKGEISGWARRKGRLSRSILKQAFLIDSYTELFIYLIQRIRFGS